jgi:hypothetical protein
VKIEDWLHGAVMEAQAEFERLMRAGDRAGVKRMLPKLQNAVDRLMEYIMQDIEPNDLPPELR